MGERFGLDVDVAELRRAQRRLAAHVAELERREQQVRGLPDQWRTGWTGASADTMTAQAHALARDTRAFARHFADAADAVGRFADAAERAEEVDIPDLNRRWREAVADHRDALAAADLRRDRTMARLPDSTTGQQRHQVRREVDDVHASTVAGAGATLSATQRRLEEEYDDLVADLGRAARRLGSALATAVALPIKVGQAGPFTHRALQRHPARALPTDDLMRELQERAGRRYGGPAGELLDRLASPPDDLDEVTAMLERARAVGLEPFQYAATLEQYWFLKAAASAGIDVTTWDPSKGAEHNRAVIMAVYRYYGDLYLENPDLQWAGMATMIGPSFAGGFLDLAMIRNLAAQVERFPPGARPMDREAVRVLANLTDEDLKFYETTLLGMQREIFFDQGTMHEAYRSGGMAAIAELHAAGIIDRTTYESWQGIHSGVPSRVQAGNEQFLLREQLEIIEDDYQAMYRRPVTGPVVTWGMTQIGAPSIPGAQGYADVDPLVVRVPTPGPRELPIVIPPWTIDNPTQGDLLVQTPFADGNVAQFDDRWRLIEQDTLPAYQRLLREDPDLARALIGADVATRVEEYRLTARADEIALDLLTDWEVVGFEQ